MIWTPGKGIKLSGTGVVLVLVAAFFYGLYAIGLGEKRTRALDSEVVIGYMLIPPILFQSDPMYRFRRTDPSADLSAGSLYFFYWRSSACLSQQSASLRV